MGSAGGGKRRAPSSGAVSLWRRFAIRLIAVCVVGVLAAAGWLELRVQPARVLTSYGRPVSNASSLLQQTEAAMRRLVHARHGALTAESRCYYTSDQPGDGGPGEIAITDRMLCGPVLFVDGDRSRPYLTSDLLAGSSGPGRVRLSVTSPDGDATSTDPRPDGQLVRPDGKLPPARYQLRQPAPPPAVGNVLTTAGTLGSPITPAPASAVMIGQVSGVRLVEYGFVGVYDWGDRARTTPPGYRLLAFATAPLPGEMAAEQPDLSVRVDGSERGPLAATSDYVVTAVPRHARRVDLVLTDSGLKQSISLLTGRPDATNPVVTVRSHDRQQLNIARPVQVRLQTGSGTGVLTGTLTVRQVSLSYWAADGDCPKPDRAWLHVGAVLQLDGDKQPYGAEPALLTVNVPGVGPRPITNAAADPATGVDDVADVPASVTQGSLTFAGSVRTPKGTLTVLTPVTIPFEIPAG